MLPPLFHTFHPVPLSDGCRVLFSMATKICYSKVLSASFLHVLVLSLCHAAIVFVHFVVRRSFVLSFSLHIRPCSLLPILPFFFACYCCFFCASPFLFCFPCFSLLFVRALCLFFCCNCFIVQQSQKACSMFNSSTNGKDITKTCTGKIKASDLVVKAWGNPPLHLYCSCLLYTSPSPRD